MFKSCTQKSIDTKTGVLVWIRQIVDDEGWEEYIKVPNHTGVISDIGIAIAEAYGKRNLDVGKNLAYGIIWWYKDQNIGANLQELIKKQDKECGAYIEDWDDIAKERDKYLKMFNVWK